MHAVKVAYGEVLFGGRVDDLGTFEPETEEAADGDLTSDAVGIRMLKLLALVVVLESMDLAGD